MPLKFNFNQFKTIPDEELITIPDFEIFSDGSNPLIRRQALIELTPGMHFHMDVVADMEGVFLMMDGRYEKSVEGSEGQTLNIVREMDSVDVVPYSLIEQYNFEV